MTKISEFRTFSDTLDECSICGSEPNNGGFWLGLGEGNINICSERNCIISLIHLLWDTIFDRETCGGRREVNYHDIKNRWMETVEKEFWIKAFLELRERIDDND